MDFIHVLMEGAFSSMLCFVAISTEGGCEIVTRLKSCAAITTDADMSGFGRRAEAPDAGQLSDKG